MKVDVVTPGELGPPEVACWRAFTDSFCQQSPFLSPDFVLAAHEARPSTRVAVLSEGSSIIGFFPFDRGKFGRGRPVAPGVSDIQAVVHADGAEWDAIELLRGCGLAVWEFDHLLADQLPFRGFHQRRLLAPVVDLSSGYEEYLAGRRKAEHGHMATLLRRSRKLERERDVRFTLHSEDPCDLRTLMSWKSAQYRRTSHYDRFARPWIVDLLERLAEAQTASCKGRLSVLYDAERPIAAHFGLCSGSTLSYWFPAYDPEYAAYSPGMCLFLRMLEEGERVGTTRVDLGVGDEDYKQILATGADELADGLVGTPSATLVLLRCWRQPLRWMNQEIRRSPTLWHGARSARSALGRMRTRHEWPLSERTR